MGTPLQRKIEQPPPKHNAEVEARACELLIEDRPKAHLSGRANFSLLDQPVSASGVS